MSSRVISGVILVMVVLASGEPQLDLPAAAKPTDEPQQGNGLKVLVLPNSYTDDKFDDQPKSDSTNRFDSDRSQRYGPPYSSNENDEYPQNLRDNERLRYGDPNANRDNFKFPQNDFSVRPQVSGAHLLAQALIGWPQYLCLF
jgi:hypothetical protein